MSTANINVRTDADIKAQAQQIFESIGLDLSTAVNLFLKQTIRANNLPFVVGTSQVDARTGSLAKSQAHKTPVFGCAKGQFQMADDFDDPLSDFAEYM